MNKKVRQSNGNYTWAGWERQRAFRSSNFLYVAGHDDDYLFYEGDILTYTKELNVDRMFQMWSPDGQTMSTMVICTSPNPDNFSYLWHQHFTTRI